MDSDSHTSNASSNCDGIEFVSDLGSEMSESGSSDNEPEPSSPAPASSPAPFVNDSNNDNNSIFSDASNDDEDVPYPDEHPPQWESGHFRNFHVPLFKGPPEGPNLPDGFLCIASRSNRLLSTLFLQMNCCQLLSKTQIHMHCGRYETKEF